MDMDAEGYRSEEERKQKEKGKEMKDGDACDRVERPRFS